MQQSKGSSAAGGKRRAGLARHTGAAAIATAFGSVLRTALGTAFGMVPAPAAAQLPAGGTVVHGTAAIGSDGQRMTIANSPNAILDWQAFSIGARNSVHFAQQGTASQVLNRVVGNDPSAILGSLSSNGGVWLINPHGVLFGAGARIDVGALVATTHGVANADFLAGRARFDGRAGGGQVVNAGRIHTSFGGSVWLVGGTVRNEGLVHSPGGQIVLAAGGSVELVDSGMPNVTVRVTAPGNEAVNLGTLLAPGGGSIDVHAGIVNQQGIVRADSIGTDAAGRVVIRALHEVRLGATSETSADAAGTAAGGRVLVASTGGATLVQGSVSAAGSGGDGGRIHLLGRQVVLDGQARVDASGATGAGEVLVGGDYQGANPAVANAETTWLGPEASVTASAMAAGDGGKVILWGDRATHVFGTIAARGGPGGGDGGLVETSGRYLDARPRHVDVGAAAGKGSAGSWLLDPGNITIGGCCSQGGVDFDDLAGLEMTSNANDARIAPATITDALAEGVNVIVRTGGGAAATQAGNIVVAADLVVDGEAAGGGSLTLQAHNDIVVNAGVRIAAGASPMQVNLTADRDGNNAGAILLRNGARIETGGGDVRLGGGSGSLGGARSVGLQGATVAAGTGAISVVGGTVDVGGGSALDGRQVGVVAGQFSLRGSRIGGPGGNIDISAGSAMLANANLGAGPEASTALASVSLAASMVALAGTRADLSGTLSIVSGATSIAGTANGAAIAAGEIVITSATTTLANVTLRAASAGSPLVIGTGDLSSTGSTLATPQGRWLIYLDRGLADFPAAALADLDYTFVQVGAPFGTVAPFPVVGAHGVMLADPAAIAVKVDAGRPYDGTTRAEFTGALSHDAPPGFTVRPPGGGAVGRGTFDDRHAGRDKPIVHGGESGYFDVATPHGRPVHGAAQSYVGDVTPKPVTADGLAAENKVYDGTRTASLGGSLSGFIDGDDVALDGATGLFDTKHAGQGKAVTVSGGALSGADAANYALDGDASTTADIAPLAISAAGIVAAGRVYDGTRDALLSGVLAEVLAGDDVSLGAGSGQFADRHAGVDKPVTIAGAALAGADAGNYLLAGTPALTATIAPRPIAIAGITAVDRVYDGTRDATLSGTLSGALAGDAVALAGAAGQFSDKHAGTGKPVTISGGTLAGADAGNYLLAGSSATTTASIAPRPISLAGIGAADKVYDGTRAATLTGALAETLPGDALALAGATGRFGDRHAGTGKPVTVAGARLAGADAGNYALAGGGTITAAITPRPVSLAGITAADKVYDGTRDAALSGALSEALPGDVLALDGATGLFDTRNAGTAKPVSVAGGRLAGADAANYVLAGGGLATAAISPRPLAIGIGGPVVKEYDAGTAASLVAGQFVPEGVVAGDALAVSGPEQGDYASAGVGQGKAVSATGTFRFSGSDAANYRVGSVDLAGSGGIVTATARGNAGAITPATLVYHAGPATGEPGLPVAGLTGTVTGFRGADTLASATTGTLAWQSGATALAGPGRYPVTGTGLAAPDYVFVQAPGNAVALALQVDDSAARPHQQARGGSVAAIQAGVRDAMPVFDPRGSGGGLFDLSDPGAARTFGAVRIGAMTQEELARLLEQRRNFKRKLFAEAIWQLEIDPSLADVRPCATVDEARTGACRITRAQSEAAQAARLQLAVKKEAAAGRADNAADGQTANNVDNANNAGNADNARVPQIERKIAVLFGINDYQDKTIPRLENAVPDVDAVARLLAGKLGYEVRVVRNPVKADIIRTLNELSTEIGSSDSVVVYYAGHGYSLERNGAGYWLPADAQASDPARWISNSDVAGLLSGIRANQMALVSDSCYSGAFARDGMAAVGRDVTVQGVLAKRSVVVLSSGGDEPVADEGKDGHSIFAWNLMEVMRSVASWTPGSTIFTDVQAGVRKEFPQTPKYGSVTAAGHQAGGDYLFELR